MHIRRDGGVVDRTGLENRRAARSRGFESLSLRQVMQLIVNGPVPIDMLSDK